MNQRRIFFHLIFSSFFFGFCWTYLEDWFVFFGGSFPPQNSKPLSAAATKLDPSRWRLQVQSSGGHRQGTSGTSGQSPNEGWKASKFHCWSTIDGAYLCGFSGVFWGVNGLNAADLWFIGIGYWFWWASRSSFDQLLLEVGKVGRFPPMCFSTLKRSIPLFLLLVPAQPDVDLVRLWMIWILRSGKIQWLAGVG